MIMIILANYEVFTDDTGNIDHIIIRNNNKLN